MGPYSRLTRDGGGGASSLLRWRRVEIPHPVRCPSCRIPITGPITETIMGLAFDGRLAADDPYVKVDVPFRTYLRA